jgi:hypothetical protein
LRLETRPETTGFGPPTYSCGTMTDVARHLISNPDTSLKNSENDCCFETEGQGEGQSDFDLVTIISVWPFLPHAIRAAIIAMVQAAAAEDE